MLSPYNILAFTEIGLPPTYVYVRRRGIVIMPECCVDASLFLIAELRPAIFGVKNRVVFDGRKSTCDTLRVTMLGPARNPFGIVVLNP